MATSNEDDFKHFKPSPQQSGSRASLIGWMNTDARGERGQRMEHVRSNSPADDRKWANEMFGTTDLTQLTPEQRKQIATAKKAYFAELRLASAAALKAKKQKRLNAIRTRLEAEAAQDGGAA